MDLTDLERYTAILKKCKKFNINDFLHDVNLYVVNRPLPPQRAASSSVFDSNCPTVVPRRRLVKMDIFESEEIAPERYSGPYQDTPLSSEESREFDQFGSMQGVCIGISMHSQRRWEIQYPQVEDTSPSRVLVVVGECVFKGSLDCNHFLSRERLRVVQLQELC